MMCEVVDKCEDSGEVSLREVSEHTPRRTGTQFHIIRGLRLWQVQYIGRWGSATVEIYAAEASAKINASWSTLVAKGIHDDLGVCADDPGAAGSSVLPWGRPRLEERRKTFSFFIVTAVRQRIAIA